MALLTYLSLLPKDNTFSGILGSQASILQVFYKYFTLKTSVNEEKIEQITFCLPADHFLIDEFQLEACYIL